MRLKAASSVTSTTHLQLVCTVGAFAARCMPSEKTVCSAAIAQAFSASTSLNFFQCLELDGAAKKEHKVSSGISALKLPSWRLTSSPGCNAAEEDLSSDASYFVMPDVWMHCPFGVPLSSIQKS